MSKYLNRLILFYLGLLIFLGCNSNESLPINQNHHRLEFEIYQNSLIKKRVGVSNIIVNETDDLENIIIRFNLIHQGNISIVSSECGNSVQEKFDSKFTVNLNQIMKEKKSCSYLVITESKNVNIKNFSIYESAIINIIYQKTSLQEMFISYNNSEFLKNYTFTNEGALQIRSSLDSLNSSVKIIAPIENGVYEIRGCDKKESGQFDKGIFSFTLDKFLKTKNVYRLNSCLLNISIFDNKNIEVSKGFLYLNVFDANTSITKKLNFKILDNRLDVFGDNFSVICSINDSYLLYTCPYSGIRCSSDYDPEKVYWIRGITPLGRKNVYAIKNGQIIWEE